MCDGMSSGSSPVCRNSEAYREIASTLQYPVFFFVRSILQSRSQRLQFWMLHFASSILRSRSDGSVFFISSIDVWFFYVSVELCHSIIVQFSPGTGCVVFVEFEFYALAYSELCWYFLFEYVCVSFEIF